MSKTPSLPFDKIIHALQRDGWIVVRQKGSHIRLQKTHGYRDTEVDRSSASSGQEIHPRSYPETGKSLSGRSYPPYVAHAA
jgi:predicted RNA binding protein YcfA (HicA-like mRNA interferase family)